MKMLWYNQALMNVFSCSTRLCCSMSWTLQESICCNIMNLINFIIMPSEEFFHIWAPSKENMSLNMCPSKGLGHPGNLQSLRRALLPACAIPVSKIIQTAAIEYFYHHMLLHVLICVIKYHLCLKTGFPRKQPMS